MKTITQGQAKAQNQAQNQVIKQIESQWMTLKEAAEYLKLNKRTLGNYVCRGLVPVHISVAGGKRFHKDDLDRWISTTKKGFIPDY